MVANLAKIPVVWDGLPGFPGLSVHYCLQADAVSAVAALTAWYNSLKGNHPTGLTWQIPSSGDVINEDSGNLVGTWAGAAGSTIAANGGPGIYASGAGMRIRLLTTGIATHRRIIGSQFLVPLLASLYETNGTIANGTVATTQTALNTLVGTGLLKIWHRPGPSKTGGFGYTITAGQVPDKVATLRSRRT